MNQYANFAVSMKLCCSGVCESASPLIYIIKHYAIFATVARNSLGLHCCQFRWYKVNGLPQLTAPAS